MDVGLLLLVLLLFLFLLILEELRRFAQIKQDILCKKPASLLLCLLLAGNAAAAAICKWLWPSWTSCCFCPPCPCHLQEAGPQILCIDIDPRIPPFSTMQESKNLGGHIKTARKTRFASSIAKRLPIQAIYHTQENRPETRGIASSLSEAGLTAQRGAKTCFIAAQLDDFSLSPGS